MNIRTTLTASSLSRRIPSILLMVGILTTPTAYAGLSYKITDLGPGSGYGINNAGQVVGGDGGAVLYDHGVMTYLGAFGGNNSGYGMSINNLGQITGHASTSINSGSGGYFSHAFAYSNGVMTDLTPNASYTGGRAVNDLGQVVVTSATSSYVYSNGQRTELGGLGGRTEAHAINNLGQITGFSYTADGDYHTFLYSNGVMTDIDGRLGKGSMGFSINDVGQITGDSGSRAFIYSNGVMSDIGTLGGAYSYGYDINNLGQVTGHANTTDGSLHAFLYSDGVMTDLNALIDPQLGWVLRTGYGVNESGQITGFGYLNGSAHAYLLTPVPEPETYAMLLAGLMLVGAAIRQRKQSPSH